MPQYGSYPSGSPAQLADKALHKRGSATDITLTVQDVLTAAGLLTASAPAALTDALLAIRAGAAIKLTIQDLQNLMQAAVPGANLILNGAFNVAQRGASMNLANAPAYGSVDRWAFAMSGTAAGVAQQQNVAMPGTPGTNSRLRLARNSGSASTGVLTGDYIIETADLVPYQGQTLTASWDAAAGAQFSAAGGAYAVSVDTGTGTDQGLASYAAGTWSGLLHTAVTSRNLVAGANALRHSVTFTLPSTAAELAFQFAFTPVGTAGADDALYLGRFKLELGSVATPFVARPYALEVELLQRYYEKSFQLATAVPGTSSVSPEFFSAGAAIASSAQVGQVIYKVRKRANGSAKTYSFVSNTLSTLSNVSGTDLAAGSATVQNPTERGFQVINSSGGSITPALGGFVCHWSVDAEL